MFSMIFIAANSKNDFKFLKGAWKAFWELVRQYVKRYKQLLVYAGPVYDSDANASISSPFSELTLIFDASIETLVNDRKGSNVGGKLEHLPPTHLFVVLLRCEGDEWGKRLFNFQHDLFQ